MTRDAAGNNGAKLDHPIAGVEVLAVCYGMSEWDGVTGQV